jgi:hypothetical protein
MKQPRCSLRRHRRRCHRRRSEMRAPLTCLSTGGGARNLGGVKEGVEIGHGARREVTKSFPPPFSPFADAHRRSRHLHPRLRACAEDSVLHQPRWRFACTARNCWTGHSSKAWPEGALRTGSCNNATQPRKSNKPIFAGPIRAKGRTALPNTPLA